MFICALRGGMPDLQCPVEEVVAEGDRVGGRFSLQGTHLGALLGIAPTGKRINAGVMVIARFDEAGKWVEDWASWDQLGMLQQLGVVPAPAASERGAPLMPVDVSAIDVNKALVRRAIGNNRGAAVSGTEIFAPDFVAHMPGQASMNRATFEHFVSGVTNGMPGYTYEIHDQIAQGDLVVNRVTWRGVHSGVMAGVPATGRSIELRGINMFRVTHSRGVEQWAELDMLGLLQQIG